MDKQQVAAILRLELEKYREMGFARLSELVGEELVLAVTGENGVDYQIEIEVLWDDPRQPGNALRLIGAIDDGRFPAAFTPLTLDFVLEPGEN